MQQVQPTLPLGLRRTRLRCCPASIPRGRGGGRRALCYASVRRPLRPPSSSPPRPSPCCNPVRDFSPPEHLRTVPRPHRGTAAPESTYHTLQGIRPPCCCISGVTPRWGSASHPLRRASGRGGSTSSTTHLPRSAARTPGAARSPKGFPPGRDPAPSPAHAACCTQLLPAGRGQPQRRGAVLHQSVMDPPGEQQGHQRQQQKPRQGETRQ